MPGTFEYTLDYIVENKINFNCFNDFYNNDIKGAPAYNPKILIKIILFAYYKGITSVREIEKLCRKNIVFIALSCSTTPHYTTIASFVSGMGEQVKKIFTDIVLHCEGLKLIGHKRLAIDGCKISSNASKEWSGTLKELLKKRGKYNRKRDLFLKKLKKTDSYKEKRKHKEKIEKTQNAINKISDFINDHEEKIGQRGNAIKSNITDNESAKMTTGHGVIQGYVLR